MAEQKTAVMPATPQAEHRWLERLVGEWSFESEMEGGPGQPPEKSPGTERVRTLGGLWLVAEARGDLPDGNHHDSLLTIGYDPARERYVGSFVSSMMTHQWVYDGQVSDDGSTLVLEADGPDMVGHRGMVRYRDVFAFDGDDTRLLTSYVMGEDGEWQQIVETRYRRRK